ncbi:restriction endonuclease subunit S [Bacillus cereus]
MSKLKSYKFDELYEMSSGISSTPEQAGHGSPFLSFSTIFNNYFLPDKLPDLMNVSEEEKESFSIQKGDIFLTRTSETLDELAMSSVAIKDYPNATFSGFAKRLRPIQNDITYYKFMGFYLRSEYFRKIINNNAIMTLRASFNENIFSYINLELPDYTTQVKIGDFLYKLEEKKDLNNKIINDLETLAKTIYDYCFIQYEFLNEENKPYKSSGGEMEYNKDLDRDIPKGWEVIKIGDILAKESKTKKIPKSEVLKAGTIPVIDQSTDFIVGYTDDENALINAVEPRIVFGDHTRILKLINFNFARGADGTQILLSKAKRMPQHLFYQSLLKIDLSNYGYSRHFKFLKENKIILPDEVTADRYESLIKPYFNMKRDLIFQNQKLTQLRDFLLPMLMTGQINLK